MSLRLPLIATLLAAGAAWWVWSSWSGATAPELRRPEGSRASEVATAATAPEAVEAETDAASVPAFAAIRGETRRAAALFDPAAPPGPRRPFVLHVVDATTRRELREVTVRHRQATMSTHAEMLTGIRSDPHFVALAQGDSPLKLSPPEGDSRLDELDVACAGHQSRRLRVEWTGGGERRVELAAAGTLRLSVRDAPGSAQLEAHLFEGGESPPIGVGSVADRIASAEGSAFAPIALLAAGRWRIELFDRGATGDPRVGGGEVVVVAGAEAKLELDYVVRPLQPLVAIAGRVVVDRAWFDGISEPVPPTRLSFWQEGRPSIRRSPTSWDVELAPTSDPAVVPFDGGLALPGPLVVVVDGWDFSTLVEVPAEGSRELEIVVPPPADVAVTVRDVVTGQPVEGARLLASGSHVMTWRSRVVWSPLVLSRLLGPSDARGRVEFCVPAGEVTLAVNSRNWPFVFVPGGNEVELTVGAFAVLSLLLRDGDAIVPWDDGAMTVVEAAGQRCFSRTNTRPLGPVGQLVIDADGPVQVHVAGVAGYDSSDRFDVSLVRGETTSVEIPLRRRN